VHLTFYRPATVLPSGTPGTLLDSKPLTLDPSWPGTAEAVTYISTTPNGDPVPVTGAVLKPNVPPPPGGYPVVVWAHGTVGLGDPCAPSRHQPFQATGADQFLAAGYLVVAPDYEGLGVENETPPYLVGEASGRNVLDAARLARTYGGSTDVVAFGHSQGGHAVLFARQLAATYAPELHLLGVVASAPVTDPAVFLRQGRTNPDVFPFTAEAILSWAEVYQEPELTDLVNVQDAEAVRLARDEWCTGSLQPNRPLDEIFRADPQSSAVWQAAAALNTPDGSGAAVPALVTHGDADTLVPVDGTVTYVDRACRAGGRVVFRRDPTWGHTGALLFPLPEIVSWIGQRFAGAPAPTTCP
jgi:acetyl esterase/lipase